MKQITLDEDDFTSLLSALGIALNTAIMQRDAILSARLLHLANAVNSNNPTWVPYDETDFRQRAERQRAAEAAATR